MPVGLLLSLQFMCFGVLVDVCFLGQWVCCLWVCFCVLGLGMFVALCYFLILCICTCGDYSLFLCMYLCVYVCISFSVCVCAHVRVPECE